MARLAIALLASMIVFGLLGCTQVEKPGWKYVGAGSDDFGARRGYCTEFAIYQYSLAHWDEEMDEEEYQEANYGRPMSARFEKKFADCMESNDWRRVS